MGNYQAILSKMKIFPFISVGIALLLSGTIIHAQDLSWARRAGGSFGDLGSDIAVDGSGNSCVTGRFDRSATFGEGEANEITLSSTAAATFVAKYDEDGQLVWVRQLGDDSRDARSSVTADAPGNSYVTGCFRGTATLGAGEANETVLSADSYSILIVKYDPDGSLIWAKQAGGELIDGGLGIAIDAMGNSYVTGRFEGSATFGVGEPGEAVLSSAGASDIFVAKYDPNGLLTWARQAGSDEPEPKFGDTAHDIAVDASGNCTMTGVFEGVAVFGAGEDNETTLTSAGSLDIFISRYNTDGRLQWAKQVGDDDIDEGLGIAVDPSGGIYMTGCIRGRAVFGGGEPKEAALTSTGSADIFVAKYEAGGLLQWAKQAGGTGFDFGDGITVNALGNSYITGRLEGLATFGPGETNETTLDGRGPSDIFIAKYDEDGLLLWARRAGGDAFDGGAGIALGSSGSLHVTGYFETSANFSPGAASETILRSAGSHDIFVASYAAEAPTSVETPPIPTGLQLAQNFPNPFNPATTITFNTPKAALITLSIHNTNGQLVRTLVSGTVAPGWQRAIWNGTDNSGRRVASGVYVYRLEFADFAVSRKMVLMR